MRPSAVRVRLFLDVLTMDPPRMVGCQPSKGQTLTFLERWSYFKALLSDLTLKAIDLGLIVHVY